ncbi:MAG: M56 family metallopeptidase [Dethiosulfatibacter sp.]|nr:M56 family metallopeptidase [Dethiosulfatibacter sp.]
MTELFIKVLNMSITATYVAVFVIIARVFLRQASKIYSYGLWSVVFFRLVSPFSFSSPFSLLTRIKPSQDYVPSNIGMMSKPNIATEIETIDRVVNQILPAPTVIASVNPMQIIMGVLAAVWFVGMSFLILYAIYSYVKIRYRVQFATLLKEGVYETDQVKTPFVIGVIKPKIYLPLGMKEKERDVVISHEQIHIKRHDHWIKPAAFLALVLHWFNPIVWLSYFLMVKDMEMSCDESVIKKSSSDIRANYSSTMLSLSANRSGLLIPLAFGESNTTSRVKNIINYRKPGFWAGAVALLIVAVLTIGLLSNPFNTNTPEARAEKFLLTYYTVDDPDIAELLFAPDIDRSTDSNGSGLTEIPGFQDALTAKYGELMTEKGLTDSASNRVILEGEIAALQYGSTLKVDSVSLSGKSEAENNNVTFHYNITAKVVTNRGDEEAIQLIGVLVMKEVEGKWRVDLFRPESGELKRVMQYGKPFIHVTNKTKDSIKTVEINTKNNTTGTMYADNTLLGIGDTFSFEMPYSNNLEFTMKALDKDSNLLAEKSYASNFSKGNDISLVIDQNDEGLFVIYQMPTKNLVADEISIFFSFMSYALFETDEEIVAELVGIYNDLDLEPVEVEIDIASMLLINYQMDGHSVASLSVDKNGVFWLNGEIQTFRSIDEAFPYDRIKEIYESGKISIDL